ncbi:MAG: holo-ACP synthase [Phycisphaerales bacterium]|nr:holo-ACP synthase [Phycisphaerales bacterium]
MSVIGHGIDIVECARIERLWREHGDVFLDRVYTATEKAYCLAARDTAVRLSGRFAVKEAVLKALGTGWRGGIAWTDIETIADEFGKPVTTLSNLTAEIAQRQSVRRWLVSISHTRELAIASALSMSD